jgi:hypothetical protein
MSMPELAVGCCCRFDVVRLRRWHDEQVREAAPVIRDKPFIVYECVRQEELNGRWKVVVVAEMCVPIGKFFGCQEILEMGWLEVEFKELYINTRTRTTRAPNLCSVLCFFVYILVYFAML